MPDSRSSSVARFYEPWAVYNQRIVEVVGAMTPDELAIRPAPDGLPVWATVAHTAGARVYWLCGVFGEPGAETTPFPQVVTGVGWEDDLKRPRTAEELTEALESTWRVIAGCLERWTPEIALRGGRRPGRQADPGARPSGRPHSPPQPRRLPLWRAVPDARHQPAGADRPLARRLRPSTCRTPSCRSPSARDGRHRPRTCGRAQSERVSPETQVASHDRLR